MIPDHHPAIFTLEEHEAMKSSLKTNARYVDNPVGKPHATANIHIFQGIAYCGKCGNKMVSTPRERNTLTGTGHQIIVALCIVEVKNATMPL